MRSLTEAGARYYLQQAPAARLRWQRGSGAGRALVPTYVSADGAVTASAGCSITTNPQTTGSVQLKHALAPTTCNRQHETHSFSRSLSSSLVSCRLSIFARFSSAFSACGRPGQCRRPAAQCSALHGALSLISRACRRTGYCTDTTTHGADVARTHLDDLCRRAELLLHGVGCFLALILLLHDAPLLVAQLLQPHTQNRWHPTACMPNRLAS